MEKKHETGYASAAVFYKFKIRDFKQVFDFKELEGELEREVKRLEG